MSRRREEVFPTVRTEGALLPSDLLIRVVEGDGDLKGLSPRAYHLAAGERMNEAASRSWSRLRGAWASFRERAARLPESDTGTTLTRENWLLILFQELGYGRLQTTRAVEIEGKAYPVSHLWGRTPIHLVGCRIDLDHRTAGVAGAARMSPHGLVQELLNRSEEHLWGIVSNGLRLRILRDNASLTRQAYVEFDLEGMMEGEVYADFVLLWLLCHQSRFEVRDGRPDACWLERWARRARQQGTRALDRLREGVQEAIESLGAGFLAHPRNGGLRDALRSGELSTQDYYREVLRLVYRLLFLFVAEDRELLLVPGADRQTQERYHRHYSTARLRRLARMRRGSKHPDLYRGLRVVMEKLGEDDGCPALGLPALGSYLWSVEALHHLGKAEITNRRFLEALRALSLTREEGTTRRVDYKNLGTEELGSVYESLLELHPTVDASAGVFSLSVGEGHERRSTGSYYTPTSLVEQLLNSTLDPVLEQAVRTDDPERAILSLKVCDPAVGSGHFLIAAAHRIARRLAFARTGDEEPSPEAMRTALRDVIGRCLYGVDVNPMAVELCKVSLWMEALEPGKPLSFLDHRIRCGNSLIGTTPAQLAQGIPDDAFTPIEGDDRDVAREWRRRNQEERRGQRTFHHALVAEPLGAYGTFGSRMEQLDALDDTSIEGVNRKEVVFRRFTESDEYRRARLTADAWCAAFVWSKRSAAPEPVTFEVFRRLQEDPDTVPRETIEQISRLADRYRFFHWQLAFPDVFDMHEDQDLKSQAPGWSGGFDVVVANPPYVNAAERRKLGLDGLKAFWRTRFHSAAGAYDLYILFLDLAQTLLSRGGRAGLLTPNKYLAAPYAEALRSAFVERACLLQITDVSSLESFADASVYPIITTTAGRPLSGDMPVVAQLPAHALGLDDVEHPRSMLELLPSKNWGALLSRGGPLIVRLHRKTQAFGELVEVCASTTAAEADSFGEVLVEVQSVPEVPRRAGWKCVNTGLIDPFCILWGTREMRHGGETYQEPFLLNDGSVVPVRRQALYDSAKIIVAKLSLLPEAVFDAEGEYAALNVNFILCSGDPGYYYLGLLSSALMRWLYRQCFGALSMGGGYMQFQAPQLRALPIVPYEARDEQVRLAQLAKQATLLCDGKDFADEIDALVSDLYELTEADRMLVVDADK